MAAAAALAMSGLVSCQRSLIGARCGCVAGWTCCLTTNRCVPDNQPGACPNDSLPDSGPSEEVRDAGSTDEHADDAPVIDPTPDARLPVVPPPDTPRACTSEGWCWTHPLPGSDTLVQAFAVAPDDLWIVGASGTILRFAGGRWSTIPSPTNALAAVWGSGSNDVWVGGTAGLYRWDGDSWTFALGSAGPSGRVVTSLWGCAADDIWAVGALVHRWDGVQWNFVSMPDLTYSVQTVWGSACDDVWAGSLVPFGGTGEIIRFNGSVWSKAASVPAERIAGTGPDDLWSLAQGQLFHWTPPAPPMVHDSHIVNLFPVGPTAVGVMNDRQMVSVLARGGGVSSLPALAPAAVTALWARSPEEMWGIGAGGIAARWDGAAWSTTLPAWSLNSGSATKVTGSGPADLWAVVGGALLRSDGGTWRTELTPDQVGGRIWDVWAPAPDDAWVLGGDALIHRWNGSGWRTEDPPPRGATTPEMRAISGSGPDDVWIVRGTNSVLHWNGETWISRQPGSENLVDIWADGPNNAWVAGDLLKYWNGVAWEQPRVPLGLADVPFRAVSGSGRTDVWALAAGYVLHGSADARDLSMASSSSWQATSVFATGPGTAWLLYQDGNTASRIYHISNPSSAERVVTVAPAGMNDIWSSSDGTLWVAGRGGALLRRTPPR